MVPQRTPAPSTRLPLAQVGPFLLLPLLITTLLHGAPGLSAAAALPQAPSPEKELLLGPLQSDREDVPLVRIMALLDQKMKGMAKAGLMRNMPSLFTLDLRVDASGAVTAIAFDRACGKPGKLMESQLIGWRMEAWSAHGVTVLRLPVQIGR